MALDKSPDMEGLTPAERAALYKQRAAAAGIGRGASPASAAPAEAAPKPAAPVAPAEAAAAPAETEVVAAKPAAPKPDAAPAAEKPAAPGAKPAAPAKPAEEKPAEPPKPAVPVFAQEIVDAIPNATWEWRHGYAEIKVPREDLVTAARRLYAAGFDYLSFVTEVDWQDRLEVLYHLYSYDYEKQPLGAILRTDLPRDGVPEVPSLTRVWPGAEFMEREAFEMLGIAFVGHPDLRKILLPDDFQGFPLRKDYETDFAYITVKQLVREFDPGYQ